jgi:uncharacterized membrane protein YphA (DoxX/SURF4 family)
MRLTSRMSTAARLVLAATMVFAGLSKIADLRDAGRTVAAYQLVYVGAAQLIGGVLSFMEVALGLLLAAGLATRAAALSTAGLMIVYTAAIVSVWVRGLSISCGCFGGGGTVTSGAHMGYLLDIVRNVAFLSAAVLLAWRPQTRFALDQWVLDGKKV